MNLKIQIKWVDKQKKQAYNKTTGEDLWFICSCNLITRGGAVRKLVGLITRRSQVQILSPLLGKTSYFITVGYDAFSFYRNNFWCQYVKVLVLQKKV